MENGKIADSQITASSQVTPAFLARLNGRFAWCSGAPQNNPYIQVSSRLTSRSQHSCASGTGELGFQQSAGVWSLERRHLQSNFLKWFSSSIFFFRYFPLCNLVRNVTFNFHSKEAKWWVQLIGFSTDMGNLKTYTKPDRGIVSLVPEKPYIQLQWYWSETSKLC